MRETAGDGVADADTPRTHQGDLQRLPPALSPLKELHHWCVWRWVLRNGRWTKPPFQACNPDWHASATDPATWSTYEAAALAVRSGHADGLSFMLADSGFGAVDLDDCLARGVVAEWAQAYIDQAVLAGAYCERTPSGTGLRIIGATAGEYMHRAFYPAGKGAPDKLELWRATPRAITITGLPHGTLSNGAPGSPLANIDSILDDAVLFFDREVERERKAEASDADAGTCAGGATGGPRWPILQIEAFVRDGPPPGKNRSDFFLEIVRDLKHGHGLGVAAIAQLFGDGGQLGAKYRDEGRLATQLEHCWGICRPYRDRAVAAESAPQFIFAPSPPTRPDDGLDADDYEFPPSDEGNAPGTGSAGSDYGGPDVHMHGSVDPLEEREWRIENLMATTGVGLISGQWGLYKTFMALELAAALMTGGTFANRFKVNEACGVLLIAAEGQSEVALRLEAVVKSKCDGKAVPFFWCESCPLLLGANAVEQLVAIAKHAGERCMREFSLPIGLILVDTLTVTAGYASAGDENDASVVAKVMAVLRQLSADAVAFVLPLDHFGKDTDTGTRGSSVKETHADLVLALLGKRDESGKIANPRLATRKVRGARQGEEFPFSTKVVEIGVGKNGNAVSTLVIDWSPRAAPTSPEKANKWAGKRLKDLQQALGKIMGKHGAERQITPDQPAIRSVELELVREEFFLICTPNSKDAEAREKAKDKSWRVAIGAAKAADLIATREVNGVDLVWLTDDAVQAEPF